MQMDFKNLCRVCMCVVAPETSQNIYALFRSDPSQPNLYGMLSSICATVFSCSDDTNQPTAKESLGLPRNVCGTCKKGILDAYTLHQKCIDTDRRLWEMIRVKQIKQEEAVTEDDQELPESSYDPLLEEVQCSTPKLEIEDDSDDSPMDEPDEVPTDDSAKGQKDTGKKPRKFYPKKQKCADCSDVFSSMRDLKQHISEQHPERAYKCCMCDKSFFDEQQLSSHMVGHTTGKERECKFCPARFKSYSGLKSHEKIHSGSLVLCSVCDKKFTSKHTLEVHMQRHIGEKPFFCSQCPMRFVTRAEVRVHATTHNKIQNHVCEICGSRFTRKVSLVNHVKIVHEGDKRYPCKICPMKFGTRDHLKRHTRTHTGEKPFKCLYCDRAYAQSGDLVKHSKIHVGEKPYSCDRCDAAFRLMTELRNHYTVHFQSEQEQRGGVDKDKVLIFTSQATLERRFEQEKLVGGGVQPGRVE